MKILHSIIQPLNDFFFSTLCFHCGSPLRDGEDRLCTACWQSLVPVRRDDFTFHTMTDRFRSSGIIDHFVPLYYFEKGKVLQSLAHSLKYAEITSFGTELGRKIGRAVVDSGVKADAILPVPLNKRKERERGYNQSEFIAHGAATVLAIPVWEKAVTRRKYTVTQTQLNAEQRKENIADAFYVEKRFRGMMKGKTVVIVDDVVTTGSTIQEIGRILKEAGVSTIIAASAGLAKLGDDT